MDQENRNKSRMDPSFTILNNTEKRTQHSFEGDAKSKATEATLKNDKIFDKKLDTNPIGYKKKFALVISNILRHWLSVTKKN